ncbi:MAG TPA: protein kinase [Vicinamibacteria bacterium]|nr:protein kinase [Vicinamibacteria bacterium]
MDQDNEPGARTPPLAGASSRKGVLRRLLDGLRGDTPAPGIAGDPRQLGRYRILHRLGQGGMGVVFAAEDASLGRRVAVKTIAEPDDSARKRFRREARAAAGVNHPNVCQVYEIGEDGGQLFIAMELLEGESLADRLRRGPLPVQEAVALGRGMLAALSALHTTGVVHRDLKPSNVFLTPHGVKLLDFGLARPLPKEFTQSLEAGTELTRPGLLVGTPRYMAPEQVLGHEVDARTDLFSAAAILYEGVSGRAAFLGTTVVEVLSATLHEQPPALAGDAAVVALDRLLRRALAKRPSDRPESAAEMAAEMDLVAAAGTSTATSVCRPLTRLVVLPFRLLRPDPEIDFLSFALADAVSASLAGLPSVVIRSSAAAARFAGESPDLKALAVQADVDRVLMGTLLRSGGQLRATAQLVEAPAGTLVSSQTLQAPLGDVFRLQDELAQRIVESLSPSLSEREGRRRGVPASARAYEFYLRANEVVRDFSQVAVARDLYRQCVDEDPSFAPAWASLGRCHRLLAKYHLDRPEENLARADEAYRRALELDPGLPLAHKLFAHREAETGRARDAMVRLLGLARSTRNDPEIFAGLVHACRYCGLLDASEAAHREARRLDPHISTSVVYTWWAPGDMARVLAETSDAGDSELRTMALEALGRQDEARKSLHATPVAALVPVWASIVRALLALVDRSPDAAAAFAELAATHTDPEALFMYAACQARVGDTAGAHSTLVASVEGGFTVPQALREHPWLTPLRDAPSFGPLVERAEAARRVAERDFQEAGGPALLGA